MTSENNTRFVILNSLVLGLKNVPYDYDRACMMHPDFPYILFQNPDEETKEMVKSGTRLPKFKKGTKTGTFQHLVSEIVQDNPTLSTVNIYSAIKQWANWLETRKFNLNSLNIFTFHALVCILDDLGSSSTSVSTPFLQYFFCKENKYVWKYMHELFITKGLFSSKETVQSMKIADVYFACVFSLKPGLLPLLSEFKYQEGIKHCMEMKVHEDTRGILDFLRDVGSFDHSLFSHSAKAVLSCVFKQEVVERTREEKVNAFFLDDF